MYTGRRGVSLVGSLPPRACLNFELGAWWPLCALAASPRLRFVSNWPAASPRLVRLQLVCRIAPSLVRDSNCYRFTLMPYPRLVCRPPPNPSAPNGTRRPEVCVSEIKEKGQSQIACFSKLVHDSTSLSARPDGRRTP